MRTPKEITEAAVDVLKESNGIVLIAAIVEVAEDGTPFVHLDYVSWPEIDIPASGGLRITIALGDAVVRELELLSCKDRERH